MFASMDKQAKLDEADTESDGDGEEEAVDADAPAPTLDDIVAAFVAKVTDNGFSIEAAVATILTQLSGDDAAQSEAA